jgi:hypothetical protein
VSLMNFISKMTLPGISLDLRLSVHFVHWNSSHGSQVCIECLPQGFILREKSSVHVFILLSRLLCFSLLFPHPSHHQDHNHNRSDDQWELEVIITRRGSSTLPFYCYLCSYYSVQRESEVGMEFR